MCRACLGIKQQWVGTWNSTVIAGPSVWSLHNMLDACYMSMLYNGGFIANTSSWQLQPNEDCNVGDSRTVLSVDKSIGGVQRQRSNSIVMSRQKCQHRLLTG